MSLIEFPNKEKKDSSTDSILGLVLRIVVTVVFDLAVIWFVANLINNEDYVLATVLSIVAVLISVILLRNKAYPLRWMSIGIFFMCMFSIYPILFTIFVAFTNFGDGHLLDKEQAIAQIEKERYLPEGGTTFSWTAFRNEAGDYALWLKNSEGVGFLAVPNEPLQQLGPGEGPIGEVDDNGIPTEIAGYTRLNAITLAASGAEDELREILFGTETDGVKIASSQTASQLVPRYVYDETSDTFTDQDTGDIYENINGTFTTADGTKELRPGFQAIVGLANFSRFFASPALRGPLVNIIIWNFAFAFLSVVMTFALGLAIAYLYNDPSFPGKKIIQSFLLIPYTIPSLITILIWRGLLNPDVGIINTTLQSWVNWSPPWFTDPLWAKAGILLVNLWLGYPYFMLICSGALQAIPQDLYQAAEVDGANAWQRFQKITLPLLLVAVGPLLVASFTFNFNNFNLIFLFIQGGPPIAGAATRAGHTDILISYVYNLAFAGGRGFDYGLASAVTILIFFIVATITLFQFRFTKMWEEVSESV
jgi:ABC-type sugar transport system permease subunit